jgi:glycosidase
VFSGADRLLASYTERDQADSVLYFSQKYQVVDGVFRDSGPTAAVRRLHEERQARYRSTPQPGGIGVAPRRALVNFIDNHDMERFLHRGSVEALHTALVYLLTTTGIPCLYYGTEQELSGGSDPANREPLWRGNPDRGLAPYDTTGATFRLIRTLIDIRKQHAPLRRGDMDITWSSDAAPGDPDAGILAYERTIDAETVLVIINVTNCSDQQESRTASDEEIMQTAFPARTRLEDVLSEAGPRPGVVVEADGELDLVVPCRAAKILVPAGG